MWLCLAVAAAHPVGDRAATQLSVLTLAADHVAVDYYAEVPAELVEMAGGTETMARELRSGLLLVVDGAPAPMRAASPAPPPRGGDHTWQFALHLRADAPPTRAVELQTANLPEADNFFAGDVWVAPGMRVSAASVWDAGEDRSLAWLRDPRHRALSVTLAPPVGPPWSWFEGASPVRAFDARPAPTAYGWMAVPALLLLLGLWARARQSR